MSQYPIVQYLQDAYAGASSPQGQASLWSAAGATAQVTGAAVAPVVGLPPAAGGLIVATAPEAGKRVVTTYYEQMYWRKLKTPLVIGGIAALVGAAITKSKFLAVVGVLAAGGYVYGKSKYG